MHIELRTKARKITWTSDEDLRCAILGGMGFSTKMITSETGLTPCQVSYRLNKAHIKRKDYRDGNSVVAKRVMNAIPNKNTGIRNLLSLEIIK